MHGVFIGDRRIGTVAKIMGNPPVRRWVAWSNALREQLGWHASEAATRESFRTRREAIAWLEEKAKQ